MRGTDERLPRARKEQLLMRELGNERLVYDEKSEEAHCLNLTAALVWDHCDGRTTVSEMAELLAKEMRVPASDEIVRFALHQLDKSELLETPLERSAQAAKMSRREMVRRVGITAAVTLPLITSIIAPTSAEAASCGGAGAPCTGSNPPCCAGCFCETTCFCP